MSTWEVILLVALCILAAPFVLLALIHWFAFTVSLLIAVWETLATFKPRSRHR